MDERTVTLLAERRKHLALLTSLSTMLSNRLASLPTRERATAHALRRGLRQLERGIQPGEPAALAMLKPLVGMAGLRETKTEIERLTGENHKQEEV